MDSVWMKLIVWHGITVLRDTPDPAVVSGMDAGSRSGGAGINRKQSGGLLCQVLAGLCMVLQLIAAGTATARDTAHAAGTTTTYTAGPDTYLDLVRRLKPGDHLQLLPGEYRHGLPLVRITGTADRPVVIAGTAGGKLRPVFVARPGHNTVSIVNSAYVMIRHLELDGRNLPVDGVKCEGHADYAHHITLEGLYIHGHDNNQQIVAISTKCPAWDWVIRHTVIRGAGTGMYLGNSDGRAPFISGIIEHNLVAGTLGYNLQIKHQQVRPVLPGMPEGNTTTIIRHNVFSKEGGGLTETARPNVLVGHWPLSGPGEHDQYLVYGNFFYQNPHEALFQGEGNIALYSNLFVNQRGDAIHIRPHNAAPRAVTVFHNTVLASGTGIHFSRRPDDPPVYTRFVTGNMVFASVPLQVSGVETGSNMTGTVDEAGAYLVQPFAPLGRMNLLPVTGSRFKAEAAAGKKFDVSMYPQAGYDFEGTLYVTGEAGMVSVGAYAFHPARKVPRWLPALTIKPE